MLKDVRKAFVITEFNALNDFVSTYAEEYTNTYVHIIKKIYMYLQRHKISNGDCP